MPGLLLLAGCAQSDATSRELGAPTSRLAVSGYAVVSFNAHHGKKTASFCHRIWFGGRSRYRVESWLSYADKRQACIVVDGAHMFSATAQIPSHGHLRWNTFPSSWLGGEISLDSFLLQRIRLDRPTLVETTSMLGLRTEHWRGLVSGSSRKTNMDVWISVDPRFPFVLRTQSGLPGHRAVWHITRLDLGAAIPDYVFSPQTHPRPGMRAVLAMPYWPISLVLTWYALYLLCSVGVIFALAGGSKRRPCRAALGILWAAGAIALMFVGPRSGAYAYLLSDVPVQLAIGLLTVVFVVFAWLRVGSPGQVAVFKGCKWPVAPIAAIGALAAAFLAVLHQMPLNYRLGLKGLDIPFLPGTLANVAVFCIGTTLLEEVVFRGYLMHSLSQRFSARKANIIQAILFAGYHVPKDMRLGYAGSHIVVDLVCMLAFGVLFGSLRLRYRNLGAGWIVHCACAMFLSPTSQLPRPWAASRGS